MRFQPPKGDHKISYASLTPLGVRLAREKS